MVSPTLTRKLLREFREHWLSLGALVAITAVGIAVFASMLAVYRDLDGARSAYYEAYRLAHVVVDCKRAPRWVAEELEAHPDVLRAEGRVSQATLVQLPAVNEPIQGIAHSVPFHRRPILDDLLLRRGSWFSSPRGGEILLDDQFARAHAILPGQRLSVLLHERAYEWLVVGTVMSPAYVFVIPPGGGIAPDPGRYAIMYLPEDFLAEISQLEGAANQFLLRCRRSDPTSLQSFCRGLEDRLDPWGVTRTTALQKRVSFEFVHEELRGLKITAAVFPAMFLLVAALVLHVMLGRIIAQQRVVIGTLRALGLSARSVAAHYLGFAVLVGLGSAALGLVMAAWLEEASCALYREFYAIPDIRAGFHPDLMVLAAGLSLVVSFTGCWFAARKAADLAPAVAMRPPPPEMGRHVVFEAFPRLWKALPFQGKMILRSVLRNPFRSGVSVLAAACSTSIVFSSLAMVDSLDELMFHSFVRTAHEDLTVNLREPRDASVLSELARMDGVEAAEAQLVVTSEVSAGLRQRRVAVQGLCSDPRLHRPIDTRGRPVPIPDHGLVLSEKLARILDVRPGDELRLRPLIGRRRERTAIVASVVPTWLGLSAYCHQDYLCRLLGEGRVSNALLLRFHRGASLAPVLRRIRESPQVLGVSRRLRSFELLEETLNAVLGATIGLMVVFAGVIAFGAVLNTALVSLSERSREVGTLRVLGYGSGATAAIFVGESVLLNLVGIAMGLWLGAGLSRALSAAYDLEVYRFPVVLKSSSGFLSLGLVLAFTLVAQLVLWRLVATLNWLDVLKIKE